MGLWLLCITIGAAACGSSTGYVNTSGYQMNDWPNLSHSTQMAIVRSELHRWHDPVTSANEDDLYQALNDVAAPGTPGTNCTVDFNVNNI